MNIGELVRQERQARRLTLRELGLLSGISSSGIARIERGERYPTLKTAEKLAKSLSIELLDIGTKPVEPFANEVIACAGCRHLEITCLTDYSGQGTYYFGICEADLIKQKVVDMTAMRLCSDYERKGGNDGVP